MGAGCNCLVDLADLCRVGSLRVHGGLRSHGALFSIHLVSRDECWIIGVK